MTLLRRVAVAISGGVVRYVSSGCKEWAEGLAREVAFIPGDWVALGWALSSMRVLLNRREAVVASVGEAVAQARRFGKRHDLQKDNVAHLLMFLQAVTYGLRLVFAHTAEQRVACGVVVLSSTYLGFELLRFRREISFSPQEDDARAWIVYYREELARISGTRIFVRFFLPLGLLFAGTLFVLSAGLHASWIFSALLGAIFAGIFLFVLWKTMQFRRQIVALDAVLAERETGGLMVGKE
jgi:hypothetical protein